MKTSEFFFKLGGSCWLLFVGGAILIVALGGIGVLNIETFSWRLFSFVFGAGGLAAMIVGGVCALWEDW